MVTIKNLSWSRLTAADIPGAVALNAEAGWNQNAADWQFMLDQGEGIGVRGVRDGELIATAMLLPQDGRFAWIAMILVTATWQRRGLASELMRRCIARSEDLALIPGLDATEAGRQVYLPLGFRDIYPLTRWQADGLKIPPESGVRPMLDTDWQAVAAWDSAIHGAPRPALLRHLALRCPGSAFVAEQGGQISGFVLARDGRRATQIGPLSAASAKTAIALLQAALGQVTGPVFLDAADHHAGLADWLTAAGFSRQRGYMRMLLGRDELLDDPARVFLIAGPELG